MFEMANFEAFLIGYVSGSILWGYILPLFKGIDITTVGSGNPGMTNVYRALGKKWAAVVFVLDFLKAYVPTLLFGIPAAAGAVLGHILSPIMIFKSIKSYIKGEKRIKFGGKGIASSVGIAFALSWKVGLIGLIAFLTVFSATRYVSVSSLFMMLTFTISSIFFLSRSAVYFFASLMALSVLTHIGNIKRLLKGEELRIEFGKSAPSTEK